MSNQSLLSEIIGDIYEASYRPDHWPQVIEKICRITRARSGAIFMQDTAIREGNGFYPYGFSEQFQSAYGQFAHMDPAFHIMQHKPVGEAVNILSDARHEYETEEYHHNIRRVWDTGFIAGANIVANETQIVGLGLHRSFSASPFEEESLQFVAELIPHLERALRIHREFIRLRVAKSALNSGFDSMMMGLVLLDQLGMPAYINPVAQSILDSHPAITLFNDTLVPTNKEDASRLRQLILSCLTHSTEPVSKGGIIGLHHAERRHPLVIMVKPVETDALANIVDGIPIYAALYMNESDRTLPISADALAQVHGLSRVEAQIAIALANGMDLDEIAHKHARSINTVRTQLRSIFHKTNTSSQPGLIRLMLTGTMT